MKATKAVMELVEQACQQAVSEADYDTGSKIRTLINELKLNRCKTCGQVIEDSPPAE